MQARCGCGCFCLKASKFFAGFAPAGAEALFFAPPKKSTQKKGGPEGAARYLIYKAASQPCPCASRENRRMRNSLRSNKRMLHPVFTAMLGCAYGRGRSTPLIDTIEYYN